MFRKTKLCSSLMLAFGGALALGSVNVFAQQAQTTPSQQDLGRVEVTGTRIRSIDLETAQPILKVTKEDIVKSGFVTAGDIINALSTAGTPDFTKGSVLASNVEQGGQYIALRNLGAARTLVLVNGKRWATSVNGLTDISNIPVSMIERVEVLKDGASAIYGSDAVAGVVNFILKRDYEGMEANAYYGSNEKGDGVSQAYDFTFGTKSDKASIMASVSLSKQGTVWAKDRNETAYTFGPNNFDANFGAGPWGRIRSVGAGGAAGTTIGGSGGLYLNHTGDYTGNGVGQDASNPANYHPYAGDDADTFNSSQQMMFTSPTDLKSMLVKGEYDFSDTLRFKATGMYSERDSTSQVAGYPLNSLSQPTYPVYISADSYYNPYGNRVQGAGNGQDLFFYRRTIEVPRVADNNFKTLHLDATLEGDLKLGGRDWNWDVGVNYNKGTGTIDQTGNLNLLNLKNALGPSFMNADGVVQCGTAAAPIPTSQCTPFNILGGPSASTPAALNYVMANETTQYGSTILSWTANATGSIYTLPAGDLGVAIGAEYRKVTGYDHPDQLAAAGYTTDLAGNPTDGGYNVKEAYAELDIPILKGVPFAEQLNLNLASRYSDYSNFGSTTNSKVSFTWKPVKDILTRGTWAQAFRAPTVGDTFGGGSQTFDTYLDPCDSSYGAAKSDPAVAARCAAAGVPTGFRQVNQAGSPVSAGGAQGIAPFYAGAGNASLKPETATTKTLGIIFSPSQLPGASVSVDWYRIELKDAITALGAQDVLNNCYVQNDPTYCTSIVRDPATGMVTSLARGNTNIGGLLTEGWDIGGTYIFPTTPYGKFSLNLDGTYLSKWKQKPSNDADWVDYTGEYEYYRVKANLALDWSMGPWSARFMTRYYGSIKDQCWNTPDDTGAGGVDCNDPTGTADWGTGVNHKHELIYNDLNVTWQAPWKGTISVGVNNIFDIKPMIVYQAALLGTSSASSVDPNLPIDRFFYVRYSQKF